MQNIFIYLHAVNYERLNRLLMKISIMNNVKFLPEEMRILWCISHFNYYDPACCYLASVCRVVRII